jgi:large repetitive protein
MKYKSKLTIFVISLFAIVFYSCKKDSPSEPIILNNGYIIGLVIKQGVETPISNVNISTDPATSYVTTNEDGAFQIANVDSGLYHITAYKNGYYSVTASVSLSHGDTAIANFVLELDSTVVVIPEEPDTNTVVQVGSILGIVRDADTDNPLSQVNITTDPVTGSIVTDANGQFYITNLSAGIYKVIAVKTAYDSAYVTVSVSLGDTTSANIFITRTDTTTTVTTGSISGHVYNSISGDPIKLASLKTDPATSVINSDTSGYFKLSNVEPGLYDLMVTKNGYVTQTISVRVSAGVNTTADLNLVPTTGSISGVVTDINGNVLYAVLVKTVPSTKVASSDRNGMFTLDNVEAGSYQLVFTHASFQTLTMDIVVQPGITTNIEATLSSP